MKKRNWITGAAAVAVFMLPWQTRWIYGAELLTGAHTEYGMLSLFVGEVLLAIVLILAVSLQSTVAKEHRNALFLGALLCGAMIVCAVFADRSAFSLLMSTHVLFAYVLFVVVTLKYVSVRTVCLAFVCGLILPSILGCFQVFANGSGANTWLGLAARHASQLGDAVFTIDGVRVLRAYGSFSHPNVFGGYLGVGLFAWWYALPMLEQWFSKKKTLLIGACGTAVLFGVLVLTGSRSAMLGVFLGLVLTTVVQVLRSPQKRILTVLGIGLFVSSASLVASFTLPDLAAELRGGGVHEERSLLERVALYEDFVPFIGATNWLTGHGVGSYVLSYADFDPGKPAYSYQPIHNAFLLFFAETGFVSTGILLWLLVMIVRKLLRRLQHPGARLTLGMGAVVFMIALYDHYLWSAWAGLVLVALVLGLIVRAGEEGDLAVSVGEC